VFASSDGSGAVGGSAVRVRFETREVGLGVAGCGRGTTITLPGKVGMRGRRRGAIDVVGGGGAAGGGRPAELEDVDGFCSGGDAEEGGGGVERHAIDGGGKGASAELVEFVGFWDGEDADDSAFVGGGGEEGAGVVEGDVGEGGAVSGDNVDGFEFRGVEEEDVAGCGGDVGTAWRGV